MSFFEILSALLIGPLKLVFEVIFVVANRFIGHPGLSIIVLSLIMNILVLPLYRRADAMQEASRDVEAKLHDGVAHIKKAFSGDERMMILQTYYRQNHYKPTDALNGSVSLLLEIPFFMAAYQFLSSLEILRGVSLGPIGDLSAPDGMLVLGTLTINMLPVIMTLVNVISSAIYLKGFPLKTKIQLYAMALFFLVFLYESPAGLVFYWTLNNVFSLVKTIFYKIKNPKKVLSVLTGLCGLAMLGYGLFGDVVGGSRKIRAALLLLGLALEYPLISAYLLKNFRHNGNEALPRPNKMLFVLGGCLLTVLIGLLIPSTLIAASPQEFVDINYFYHPIWFVVSACCMAAGLFLVWMGVFYWLAGPAGKVLFDKLVWILCGVMLVNYMFFGTDLGIISANLQYDNGLSFTIQQQLINLAIVSGVVAVMWLLYKMLGNRLASVMLTVAIAMGGMSAVNIFKINDSVSGLEAQAQQLAEDTPSFNLSKKGKNVVVIMLDRAMGTFVPYLFNEKPELEKKFNGFTYYSNTISFGGCTNFAAPALYGGYEYTPVEMNKRDTELLKDKNNEALKVMPVLFAENGYEVTVCDPPYANYEVIPDLSIYDEYPEIQAYITEGTFEDNRQMQIRIEDTLRNIFCFSAMKAMPLFMQEAWYDGGRYNQAERATGSEVTTTNQVVHDMYTADGINSAFMKSYNVLVNLPEITSVTLNCFPSSRQ